MPLNKKGCNGMTSAIHMLATISKRKAMTIRKNPTTSRGFYSSEFIYKRGTTMSDNIAFKIQLGIMLPKLKSTIQTNLTSIIEDHINLVKEGTLEGEEAPSLDDVKVLVMQSLEIFLDNVVLPSIDAKINPAVVEEEVIIEESVEESVAAAPDEPEPEPESEHA